VAPLTIGAVDIVARLVAEQHHRNAACRHDGVCAHVDETPVANDAKFLPE
jgi:hypothetical protein